MQKAIINAYSTRNAPTLISMAEEKKKTERPIGGTPKTQQLAIFICRHKYPKQPAEMYKTSKQFSHHETRNQRIFLCTVWYFFLLISFFVLTKKWLAIFFSCFLLSMPQQMTKLCIVVNECKAKKKNSTNAKKNH